MITTKLPLPTNDNAFVLHCLLNRLFTCERDLKMNGFRARISELRLEYNVTIGFKLTPFVNRFGKKKSYRDHFIDIIDEPFAVSVYDKVNYLKPKKLDNARQ